MIAYLFLVSLALAGSYGCRLLTCKYIHILTKYSIRKLANILTINLGCTVQGICHKQDSVLYKVSVTDKTVYCTRYLSQIRQCTVQGICYRQDSVLYKVSVTDKTVYCTRHLLQTRQSTVQGICQRQRIAVV